MLALLRAASACLFSWFKGTVAQVLNLGAPTSSDCGNYYENAFYAYFSISDAPCFAIIELVQNKRKNSKNPAAYMIFGKCSKTDDFE